MTETSCQHQCKNPQIASLIRDYERNLISAQAVRRNTDMDEVRRERELRGLELANKWILTEAATLETDDVDLIRCKLELWRLSALGLHPDHQRTPEEDLIASVTEDLARLSITKG